TSNNAQQNAKANAQGGQQGVITLNEQQNTRVSAAIRQANIKPLTDVSFSIAVGTTVPADIQLHRLPPALVEVVPQYGTFSVVGGERGALITAPSPRATVAGGRSGPRGPTGAAPGAPPPPAQATNPPPSAPAEAAAPPPREHKKN